jgi:hypothetical protein
MLKIDADTSANAYFGINHHFRVYTDLKKTGVKNLF